jgi:hypothetical protein
VAAKPDYYFIDRAVGTLKKELGELAHSALNSPAQRDAYEYGRMVGNYAGLKRAVEIIEAVYFSESEDDDHGQYRRGESPIIRS